MLPLGPNCVTVTRPSGATGDYEDDTGSSTTVARRVRAAIVAPSGADEVVGGQKVVVDAEMRFPPTPTIEHTDLVVDVDTDDAYRVVWVRRRRGLGLDHQAVGLRSVTGAASG